MNKNYADIDSYSRRIKFAKIFLASLSAVILMLICFWPYLFKKPTLVIEKHEYTTEMLNPNYYGMDSKNRPFTITAEKAYQVASTTEREPSSFKLVAPDANIDLGEQNWAKLRANFGLYDQEKQELTLTESVVLLREDGQEYLTEKAIIDLKTGHVYGDMSFEGKGPRGSISSQGFEIFDYGQKLVFTGKAKDKTKNVHLVSGNKEGFGDQIVYDLKQGLVSLFGEAVVLKSENNTIETQDRIEYNEKTLVAQSFKHSKLTLDKATMTSDRLKAQFYELGKDEIGKDQIDKGQKPNADGSKKLALQYAEAHGHVVIKTQKDTLKGDYGYYDPLKNTAFIKGNVVIYQNDTILKGNFAKIDMTTGISTLTKAEKDQTDTIAERPSEKKTDTRVRGYIKKSTLDQPKSEN